MSINELFEKIYKVTKDSNDLKKKIRYYKEQNRLHSFDYIQKLLTELQTNTFTDNFYGSPFKITISDNHLDGTERSFIVDTLSPEFLKALENELKCSLTKKAVQLNNLLLSTAEYDPILDNKYNGISVKTYKDYDFKIGDKVKVTYKPTINESKIYWNSQMDKFINNGITYTILKMSDISQGYILSDNYREWVFPPQSLTLVESVSDQEYLQEE
jgi:hypothetical protein